MSTRRVPDRTGPESYKVLPVREVSDLYFGPAGSKVFRPGARASAGHGSSGEFRFEQELEVGKCYLSGRPLCCTSSRPLRKHVDQETGRMPIRRVPFRITFGSYKILPVREASGLHIGPAGSKAFCLGARAIGASPLAPPKPAPATPQTTPKFIPRVGLNFHH